MQKERCGGDEQWQKLASHLLAGVYQASPLPAGKHPGIGHIEAYGIIVE